MLGDRASMILPLFKTRKDFFFYSYDGRNKIHTLRCEDYGVVAARRIGEAEGFG